MWAIQALKDSKPADMKKTRLTTRDNKGHVLALDQSGLLAYCTKCFVSRASHQSYHVCVHPCKKSDAEPWLEGEERTIHGHEAMLKVFKWKSAGMRPAMVCKLCGESKWATTPFSLPCPLLSGLGL